MKRTIKINQGIIGGYETDTIIEILPQLKDSFRQRKTYYEYYFDETELELTLETLDELSDKFTIVLDYEDLTIKVS